MDDTVTRRDAGVTPPPEAFENLPKWMNGCDLLDIELVCSQVPILQRYLAHKKGCFLRICERERERVRSSSVDTATRGHAGVTLPLKRVKTCQNVWDNSEWM